MVRGSDAQRMALVLLTFVALHLDGCTKPTERRLAGPIEQPVAAPPSCSVGPVPDAARAAFSLSPFYAKYAALEGFPIVSSPKVPDAALCAARDVLAHMVEHRPALLGRLVDKRIRLAIMSAAEVTTDVPEHSDLTPKEYWDKRARGLGATLARPAVSGAEENLLCHDKDRYRGESIVLHELAHTLFEFGVAPYEPATQARLDAAYVAAKAEGRFTGTYARENANEYWAEGVQDWFDTNLHHIPPDGVHNEIHTRAQLRAYDPALAAIIEGVFGDRPWRYTCP